MRELGSICGAIAAGAALALTSCGGGDGGGMASYVATNLVSNVTVATNPYKSANVDANLVNGWGIAFNPMGFVWVADNATSKSTLYDGNGVPQSLVVPVPPGSAKSWPWSTRRAHRRGRSSPAAISHLRRRGRPGRAGSAPDATALRSLRTGRGFRAPGATRPR